MPDWININVDVSEFDEYMSKIADPARLKKITRKALRKGARVTQAAIQARAPIRPDLPSGTALPVGALSADIIIKSYTDSNGVEVASVQPGALTSPVAGWVEFGHQAVTGGRLTKTGRGNGKNVGFVPAHPFFRPGVEESAEAAATAIVESLSTDATNENASTAAA